QALQHLILAHRIAERGGRSELGAGDRVREPHPLGQEPEQLAVERFDAIAQGCQVGCGHARTIARAGPGAVAASGAAPMAAGALLGYRCAVPASSGQAGAGAGRGAIRAPQRAGPGSTQRVCAFSMAASARVGSEPTPACWCTISPPRSSTVTRLEWAKFRPSPFP